MEVDIPKFLEPELIIANHSGTTTEDVRIDFSEEQMNDLKTQFFLTHKAVMTRKNAVALFKEAMEKRSHDEVFQVIESLSLIEYGDLGTKSMDIDLKYSMKIISQGYQIVSKLLYKIAYYEESRMAHYDAEGHLQYHRPLRPDEMQMQVQDNIRNLSSK